MSDEVPGTITTLTLLAFSNAGSTLSAYTRSMVPPFMPRYSVGAAWAVEASRARDKQDSAIRVFMDVFPLRLGNDGWKTLRWVAGWPLCRRSLPGLRRPRDRAGTRRRQSRNRGAGQVGCCWGRSPVHDRVGNL